MRKSLFSAIAAAAAVVAVLGTSAASSASTDLDQAGPASPLQSKQQVPFQIQAAHHKLVDTVIAGGYSGAALSPGFNAIDSGETINCPNSGKCTLEANMTVQALGSGSSNSWAICFYVVDLGSYATCPYIGYLSSTYYQTESINAAQVSLPPGPHVVQTQVYTANGGTAYNYSMTYHAYKP